MNGKKALIINSNGVLSPKKELINSAIASNNYLIVKNSYIIRVSYTTKNVINDNIITRASK